MITYISLIEDARMHRASDIHLSEGSPIRYRIDGELQMAEVNPSDAELKAFITSLLSDQQKERLYHEDMDFAMEDEKGNRQRVNVYYQQGRLAATIRLLNAEIPDIQKLGLPEVLLKALGVSILAHVTATVCRDAGEGSMAYYVELGAKIEILILSLPLLGEMLSLAMELLEMS